MTYERKEKIVKKLNERMRKTVNKLGKHVKEYDYWANKLNSLGSIKKTTGYTSEGKEFALISRKRSDIEAMNDQELLDLLEGTRTWTQVKEGYTRKYNEENPEDAITPGTDSKEALKKLQDYTNIVRRIQDLYEKHADIFYMLLVETGWDDVHAHTSEEILDELLKIESNYFLYGETTLSEEEHNNISEDYKRRREEAQRIREEAGIV